MQPLAWPARLAAIALTAAVTMFRPALAGIDLHVYDAIVAHAVQDVPARVAVVAIDDAALAEIGQWPWPRSVLASLVDAVRTLGATSVVFDVLLAEPDRGDSEGDAALAEAVRRIPTVTGHAFVFDNHGADTACAVPAVAVVESGDLAPVPRAALFDAVGILCSLGRLTEAAGSSGFLNAAVDADGSLRRVPVLARYHDAVYPSLALAAALRLSPSTVVRLEARGDGTLAMTLGERAFALDERGRVLVPPYRSPVPIPALDVLRGRAPTGAFDGAMVFIGSTALGIDDTVTTPLDAGISGVRVQAALAAGLLGRLPVERPAHAALLELATAILGCGALMLVTARTPLVVALAAAVVGAATSWLAATTLLVGTGLFLSPLFAMTGIAAGLGSELAVQLAQARRRAQHEQQRRENAQRLIVQALAALAETRDYDTGLHARRTQSYARVLSQALARHDAYRRVLTPAAIDLIATLAPLHDIGKVGVSDAVLRKPGTLSQAELAEIRRHPDIGHESLQRAEALAGVHDEEVLRVAKEIVYTHHECWDGSGYPRGLRGQAIPISGRIIAVVDAYDAMTSVRSYHAARAHRDVVRIIEEDRGVRFDPDVVDALVAAEAQFEQLSREPFTDSRFARGVATHTGSGHA
ncbi:MAG TPA: CHASE2 domain-containing protein [Vicinamibacterales bacterium]|nr:CHASE2 domain-containing protein [Vicinamibacterales bacterium]